MVTPAACANGGGGRHPPEPSAINIFECKVCGFAYPTPELLRLHYELQHGGRSRG